MDKEMQEAFEKSKNGTNDERYEAYLAIIKAIDKEVDWAYEVWDQLVDDLTHSDNHQRSRAAQYLAGLAKSDPELRIMTDFPKLWEVTKDEKFVTARHSLQSMWKVAIAGTAQKELVLTHLVNRFKNGVEEKNYTLIRNDIIENMKQIYDHDADGAIKETALELIETVEDEKYKKKYTKIWK